MGQLLFKKCFFEAIRGGTKRTTLRRWSAARVRAGQRAFSPGLGWLQIEAVDAVELEQLTGADARADGFDRVSDMLKALREIYPDQEVDGRRWFRVKFRCEDGVNAAAAAAPARRTKRSDRIDQVDRA
jgi:hypothetical protein